MKDDEPQLIWDILHNLQLVFHPQYAPEGKFEYKEFTQLCLEKKVSVFLDRNLLSSLLKLCESGTLKNKLEMKSVAAIMIWSQMERLSISAGLAISENASKFSNSEFAKVELQKFNEIFNYYPGQIWLKLLKEEVYFIPPCDFSNKQYPTNLSYHNKSDHFIMNYATVLHIAYLYRKTDLSPIEKLLAFFEWNFKYLLIGQYINTYVVMLFTNQMGIKPPKNINSNNIEEIEKGCYNQAWDLTYLSNWSTLYWEEFKENEIFLFATADIMLKRIFINTHGDGNLFDLIYALFSKKQAQQIVDFYERKASSENRIKPNFGEKPENYFIKIVRQEKENLKRIVEINK